MRQQNTPAFTFLAWISFVAAVFAEYIGIYTLQETLSVKGYYAVTAAFLIMSSFVLQKTIRDNQTSERKNTSAFTALSYASFTAAILAEYIGIWTLQETLSVKGYYAVTAAFMIMSSFVLQKVIRDNQDIKETKQADIGRSNQNSINE